jgi:predicted nuclease of predicted toxin-antitoxin system
VHTSELPDGNRTVDADICAHADAEGRVVVTKDREFRDSHLLRSTPARLLIVATGNITNTDLLRLFDEHIDAIVEALDEAHFVELAHDRLVIHRDRQEDR